MAAASAPQHFRPVPRSMIASSKESVPPQEGESQRVALEAAQLAREAQLFKVLYRLRQRQHGHALGQAKQAAAEAVEAESQLVFTADRADWAREQLQRLLSNPRLPAEDQRQLEATEAILQKQQELNNELCARRQRSALAVSRLRALRALCELGGCGSSEVEGGISLLSSLSRCEEGLLSAEGSRGIVEPLAEELEECSLISLAVPLLQGKVPEIAASATTPATGSSPNRPALAAVIAAAAATRRQVEENRLHQQIEELTKEREVLRAEAKEAAYQKRRRALAATDESQHALQEVIMLRRELADAYVQLAQLGDSQLHVEGDQQGGVTAPEPLPEQRDAEDADEVRRAAQLDLEERVKAALEADDSPKHTRPSRSEFAARPAPEWATQLPRLRVDPTSGSTGMRDTPSSPADNAASLEGFQARAESGDPDRSA